MGRYTTVEEVRRLLRTPGSGKWVEGGVWDETIRDHIETVEDGIDNLLEAWPVNAPDDPSERDFLFEGVALEVDWFVGVPTVRAVNADNTAGGSVVSFPVGRESASRGRRFLSSERFVQGRRYRVSARWGHPKIPAAVRTAAAQWSARRWHESSSPLGIVEMGDGGGMRVYGGEHEAAKLLAYWCPPSKLVGALH